MRTVKLHLRPEAKQGAISALALWIRETGQNLIEMEVIDPEAEVHYLLQAY